MTDPVQDWRFGKTALDPAYSGMDRAYGRTGALAPKPLTAPVTAASRIIPPPANTNWSSTFVQNTPSSPSGTDWQKTFGQKNSFVSSPSPQPSAVDESRRSLGVGGSPADTSSFYKDRTADMDLTQRDHQLYGAGPDLGFTY
jgi:hypothetical protein